MINALRIKITESDFQRIRQTVMEIARCHRCIPCAGSASSLQTFLDMLESEARSATPPSPDSSEPGAGAPT